MTEIEATQTQAAAKEPQLLFNLLSSEFLLLRKITIKVMKCQALGNVVYILMLFIYSNNLNKCYYYLC